VSIDKCVQMYIHMYVVTYVDMIKILALCSHLPRCREMQKYGIIQYLTKLSLNTYLQRIYYRSKNLKILITMLSGTLDVHYDESDFLYIMMLKIFFFSSNFLLLSTVRVKKVKLHFKCLSNGIF
jgi:hypothetical protein